MAPKSQQATSARQELIEVVQSLTQQLQKADEAVLAVKAQARSEGHALAEELRVLRTKFEQRDRERDELLADKNALIADKEHLAAEAVQEQAQRKEAEHQLSLARQALSNSQREAKHYQDTLALTDRHNASALSQARKDAQNWKDQFERMNTLLQAQQLQIDNLVMTLKEYLSRSTLISEEPPTVEPIRNHERYVGPTIVVPLRSRRVKKEDVEGQIWREQQDDAMQQDVSSGEELLGTNAGEYIEDAPSTSRSRGQQQTTRTQTKRPRAANTGGTEAVARRRESQHYVEVEEDEEEEGEDDEMAIGYEERQSATLHPSPSLQRQSHPNRHRQAQPLKIAQVSSSRKPIGSAPSYSSSPTKTALHRQPQADRRPGGGLTGSAAGNSSVKKRKIGSGRGLDDDEPYRR